jgi:hypothetical protein
MNLKEKLNINSYKNFVPYYGTLMFLPRFSDYAWKARNSACP